MKNKSIQYYFFSSIGTVLVASVLVMGLIQTVLGGNYFKTERLKQLQHAVTLLSQSMQDEQSNLGVEQVKDVQAVAQLINACVFITSPTGAVILSAGQDAPAIGSQLQLQQLLLVQNAAGYTGMGQLAGLLTGNYYISAAPLVQKNGFTIGYVFAASSASAQLTYLADTMSAFFISATAVLLVSGILAFVLARRTVAPIRSISAAAGRFAQGDFSARVPVQGGDELAGLAVTFNEMAGSFQATDTSRRNFMGNIAHELRTPMTTIKGFIDGMLDGTIPPQQRDKYLVVVSDEVGRLARLTKNMLDISRLEAGEYVPNNKVFDIWAPISSVVLGAQQRLLDKTLDVTGLEDRQAALVLADEDFVHQILFNLVDNAIKFANDGGSVGLQVLCAKGQVKVSIHNTGVGIAQDALPYVFDRFYKADKSRGVNARGAGLGLHISKVLLGLMAGRIWAESQPGGGSTFIFTLPAAPPAKRHKKPGASKAENDI